MMMMDSGRWGPEGRLAQGPTESGNATAHVRTTTFNLMAGKTMWGRRDEWTSTTCLLCPSSVCWWDITIHILFQEGGRRRRRRLQRLQFSRLASFLPLLENRCRGSPGDVITVQSTCKTRSPGECISLIDHSWLLFLTVPSENGCYIVSLY